MELNLNGLPNDAIHVSGFSGEDGGFVKLNVTTNALTPSTLTPSESWTKYNVLENLLASELEQKPGLCKAKRERSAGFGRSLEPEGGPFAAV
jgi:hypothetical protein